MSSPAGVAADATAAASESKTGSDTKLVEGKGEVKGAAIKAPATMEEKQK
jgi:hypothetical protein